MARARATDVQTLMATAARLFERKGYQNTTIDDLAAAASISKPTVYQYVKSKQWLLENIFSTVVARLGEDQERVLEEYDDPLEQLVRTVHLYVRSAVDLRTYFLIYFGEQNELSPAVRKRLRAWGHGMTGKFAGILERAAAEGAVRPDVNLSVAANLIVGMLVSVSRWYDETGRFGPDEIADEVLTLLAGFIVEDTRPGARGSQPPLAVPQG